MIMFVLLVALSPIGLPLAAAQGTPPILWMGGGHAGGINGVFAAADGTLWTSGKDFTIKHWRDSDGQLLRTFSFDYSGHDAAAVSKNGKRAAFVDTNGTISVYDLTKGTLLQTFPPGQYGIERPNLSADGSVLLYIKGYAGVTIGQVSTGKTIGFSCSTNGFGDCFALALSADGSTLAVVFTPQNTDVSLYRTSDGSLIRTLTGHTNIVTSLAFSADNKLLASASSDSTIQIWRLSDFLLLQTIPTPNETMTSLAFSPDSSILASGNDTTFGATGVSELWKVSNGALLATVPESVTCISGLTSDQRCIDVTPDGKLLATAGNDSSLRLWSVPSGKPTPYIPGHTDAVNAVAYSPNGNWVASASRDQTVKVWDAVKGTVIATLTGHTGSVNGLAFSPDGKWLASASTDMTVKVWSTTGFKLAQTLTGHTQAVMAVSFSPNGSLLASGSDAPEQEVKLWAVGKWNVTRSLTGSAGGITSVAFLGNGEVAAGSLAGIGRLWSVANGSVVQSYVAPGEGAMSLSFSPDHKTLAVGWTTKVLLFNPMATLPLNTINAHTKDGTVAAYSPDGRRLISANSDGTVKYWNLSDWSLITAYNQETDAIAAGVLGLAFSPSSNQFAYGRGDATVVAAKSSTVLTGLSLSPSAVSGGTSSNATITLSAPVGASGATVTLSSGNSGIATVPASVFIAAGKTSATFTVTTKAVKAATLVKISDKYLGLTASANLSVQLSVASFALSPSTVKGGAPSTGTLSLSGPAPTGGLMVGLSSSNTAVATVPSSVTVPAGSSMAKFTVTTKAVTKSTVVNISSTYSTSNKTVTLTVTQ